MINAELIKDILFVDCRKDITFTLYCRSCTTILYKGNIVYVFFGYWVF